MAEHEILHEHGLLESILLLLVMSVGAVAAFRTLHLPPILGYLLVGTVMGTHGLGFIPESEGLAFMGEVGVVFLLFAIGLEFSLKQFMAMRTTIIGLGGLQVVISTLSGIVILSYFGVQWQSALVAGGAMAMSSTAIVVKQLTDQAEMRASHGQSALGILLFQDIAVVPFLVMIPLLAGSGNLEVNTSELLLNIFSAAVLFFVMLLVGHYTLRPLFQYISRAESIELFNITVLLVALTAAWLTQSMQLSLALGAFLAGMLLSETEYKHQIESEIRPFRDILMGIFFITVGTKLNISVLPSLWLPVLLLVVGIIVGKGLLIAVLTRLFVKNNATSLRTGLVLAQGGEFGFALLALALSNQVMSSGESQTTLAAIVISMALSPFIIRYNDKITNLLLADTYSYQKFKDVADVSAAVKEADDHVIICGYRRMGQNIARFLQEQGVPYIALDLDPSIVEKTWEAGDPVHYADATRPEILMAAGLDRARMVVITVVDVEVAKRIIEAVRLKRTDVPVLVRTRDERHLEALERLGATSVLPESLEATLMITQRIVEQLGFSPDEVFQMTEKIRQDSYRSLHSYYHGDQDKPMSSGKVAEAFLHTFTLQMTDYAVGKRIEELELKRFAVNIKALRRGDIRGDEPSATIFLQTGDVLVLEGTKAECFREVENLLKTGGKLAKNSAVATAES
ncbi:monovalent cation:H+ antiporter-2, CPA2 family [Thiothrix caldifontis]|uniref:Monovalent cation:H+ antiporter-2, CPA2 family n=1 Tax=Thiothrix caldifontis TaxID=525918 RepID=A0A1H4A4Z0_9GAMM|nr:cation:proton antiporter [Thiothrix caldifontis]SEA30970.1 monovalent cation:H+ antiporter-2, CPA2 family [Thiothrix caldifontis]